MKQVKEKSGHGVGMILKLTAILSAVLALICFAAPSVRKSDALRGAGEATMTQMRAAVTVISYYSAQQIDGLIAKPAINADYKSLAGLLSQLNTQQNYLKSYLLYRADGKTLRCLVDGSYRDNAGAGVDYFVPGTDYPSGGAYKPVKAVVDKVYSGKTTGGYTAELVTRPDFRKVAVTCLPVYGAGHSVAAVLCIETDPGDTSYHMVGSVNLYYAGLAFTAAFAICLLLLALRKKYLLHKQQKLEAEAYREQQAAQPATAGQDAESAVSEIRPSDDKTDLQQAPGSNIDTLQ